MPVAHVTVASLCEVARINASRWLRRRNVYGFYWHLQISLIEQTYGFGFHGIGKKKSHVGKYMLVLFPGGGIKPGSPTGIAMLRFFVRGSV